LEKVATAPTLFLYLIDLGGCGVGQLVPSFHLIDQLPFQTGIINLLDDALNEVARATGPT